MGLGPWGKEKRWLCYSTRRLATGSWTISLCAYAGGQASTSAVVVESDGVGNSSGAILGISADVAWSLASVEHMEPDGQHGQL